MKNYGIFTQICVLQGFNAKETKNSKKSIKEWLRQEMQNVVTFMIYVATKFQGNQQNYVMPLKNSVVIKSQNNAQENSRKNVSTFHSSIAT